MSKTLIPTKTRATLRTEAAAEKARKTASKAALKAAIALEKAESTQVDPVSTQSDVSDPVPEPKTPQYDDAAFLVALRVDFEALGQPGGDFAAYVREQGVDPDTGATKVVDKEGYTGPMVALKTARKHYVEAKNGILCNGDKLAVICGAFTREQTVKALILALKLPGNPYPTLNPGQQSMNLRNKARHALKNGMLTMAEIEAAYAA
jgi:hypothetical protein